MKNKVILVLFLSVLVHYVWGFEADFNQVSPIQKVVNGIPDFIVTSVSGPSSVTAGQTVSVSATCKNQSASSSQTGYVVLRMIFSPDNSINLADTYYKDYNIPSVSSLSAGSSLSYTFSYTIPSNLSGTYYWGAYVDAGTYFTETNEGNNAYLGNSVSIVSAPTTPTSLSVVYQSSGNQNYISWNSVSGATSYKIYWGTSSGVSTSSNSMTTTSTSFAHSGVSAGYTYYYKVVAVNTAGQSSLSSEVSATVLPSTPIGVSVVYQSSGNQNYLSWNSVSGASSYKIYWGTSSGVGTSSNSMTTTSTNFAHSGLSAGYTYYYKVVAVNAAGQSSLSSEVNAAVPALTDFIITSVSGPSSISPGQSVSVSVTCKNQGGTSSQTGYVVLRMIFSNDNTINLADTYYQDYNIPSVSSLSGGSSFSYTFNYTIPTGVSGTYYWGAYVDAGTYFSESNEGNNALCGNTATIAPPPTIPTNVSVTYQSSNSRNFLTWNSVSGATSYKIYWSTVSGVSTTNTNTPQTTTTTDFGHTGVQAGYTYYYRVAAVNSSGESALSTEVSISPAFLLTPTQNETITTGGINFSWTAIPTATSYELYVDNNSGLGSPEISPTIPELKNLTATQFAISPNWLTPGNNYYWKVIAKTPTGDVSSTVGNFTYSPTLSTQPQWVPVYRTYNKTVVDHFYCTASNHLQTAVDNGFKYEKNEGYVSLVPFQTSDLKCIYRLYKSDITNTKASFHYYTTDDTNRDLKIISGWTYEGITGYCYGNYHTNSVKLFHVELNQNSPDIRIDHFYTTSEIEKNNAIHKQSYIDRGFIGYVSLDGDQTTVPKMESQPEVGSGINPMNGSLSNVQKTSFSIPEGEIGLSFTHLYNSGSINFMTPFSPLGAGWNHNYNISLMVSGSMVVVYMPSEINVYDRTTLQPITKGVYNKLSRQTEKIYRLKFKNQTEYAFEMMYDNDSTAVLTSITDRHNNVIRLIHDDYRRLISVKTPTNRSLDFTYFADTDKKYLIQLIKDPLNRTIKFDYDDNNNLIKFTDAKNQITNYDYGTTPFGLYLNSITYADGTKIINTFDATSKRLTSQNYISNQTSNQTRISTLNNNKVTVTDENNKWIEMSYDITGNITDLMTAQGAAKYKYTDATNPTKPTEITDGKGYVTTATYNSMGDPLTINKPLSITHKYEWNATNDLVKYTNPLNYITSFTYTNGNLTAISTPRGTTNMTYFSNGNINTVNDPLSQTITYSYDGYNNIKTISDVIGNKTQYDYDLASRITKVTDANNQVTNYTFDENDLLKSTVDALTKTTQYSYNASNRLTAVTDARGNSSSMSFNSITGLLDYSSDQLGSKTNYTYFENGTLKSITNRNSQAINYAYDEINRLSTITGSGISRTFTYDFNDNIVKIDDGNGSLGFTYDELNRLASHTDFYNNQIQYGYDKVGNVTQRTYKTGKTVNYTYYTDNLLYTVKDWDNRTTTYTYRNDGSLDQISLPNGTYTKYTYDSAGRLIGLANKKSDGTVINSYSYTLDGVGNHVNVTANEPLTAPTLTTVNLSYSYNKANRILNAGSTTFTHDGNGNMLSQNDNGTVTGFTYDAENKLTGASGLIVATYLYDAMGYRRSATRNGITTRYVLDVNGSMENTLMETDASNNPIYYYIQGNGLLYRIKASDNSVQYYQYDSRGSTIAITDQNQNITHKYTYDEFGKVTNSTEADFNPYRYVGQYGVMYENSDLYFMRARYYKPAIGRFMSEDPVWAVNLFTYSDNNPILYLDPKGTLKYKGFIYNMTNWVDNPGVLYSAQVGKMFFSGVASITPPGAIMAAAINTIPTFIDMANGDLTYQAAFSSVLDLSTSLVGVLFKNMSKFYEVSTTVYDYYSKVKDLNDAGKTLKSNLKPNKKQY